jgi:hypothetical protein
MSEARTVATAAQKVGTGVRRAFRAFGVLEPERRQAALAAIGLFITLFLPWYQETVIVPAARTPQQTASLTGWGAFSFVEAAVLLVAAGILTLLFQRAEGKAFHLPGGDGGVITFAGFWTCVLIVWRVFDKQGATVKGVGATASGIEWGIFVALGVAIFLTYSGNRIRRAHAPEPPLPGQRRKPPPQPSPPAGPAQPAPTLQFTEQLDPSEAATRRGPVPASEAPTRRGPVPASETPTRRGPVPASEAPTRRGPIPPSEAPTRRNPRWPPAEPLRTPLDPGGD